MIRNSFVLILIFHPFDKIVNEYRPGVIFAVIFVDIFDMVTELEHHVP